MIWKILFGLCLVLAVEGATYHGVKRGGKISMNTNDTVIFRNPRRFPVGKDKFFNVTCLDYGTTPMTECRINIRQTEWCRKDYLAFSDGSAMINEKYCGYRRINSFPSGSGELFIHFHSRPRWNGRQKVKRFYFCKIQCQFLSDLTTASTISTSTTTTASTASTTTSTTASTTTVSTTPTPAAYEECECGIPNRAVRIVGGEETEQHEYPWQCGLVSSQSTRPFCGCSIINNEYLITAAHCFSPNQGTVSVILGDHDFTLFETPQEERRTATVTIHPNYNDNTYENDIAILKLTQPVDLNQMNLHPVCLPTDSQTFYGDMGKVTGWGNTQQGGSQSEVLREVDVPIWSRADCDGYPGVSENMICAGYPEGGKDSCQGDSGGPLTVEKNGHYILAGIVSWGRGCAQAGNPGVYTNVPRYLDWISAETSGGKTCAKGYTVGTKINEETTSAATSAESATTSSTAAPTEPATVTPGFDCVCGSPSMSGSGDSIDQNPWAVALSKSSGTFCSGVLINTLYVLTSSSCGNMFDQNNDEVIVNAPNAALSPPGPIIRNVVQKINNGDVTLMKVDLALSPIARPGVKNLCLPKSSLDSGNTLWSSGYSGSNLKQTSGTLSSSSGGNRLVFAQNSPYSSSQANGGPVFGERILDGKPVKTLVGVALDSGKASVEMADISKYISFIAENASSGRYCQKWMA